MRNGPAPSAPLAAVSSSTASASHTDPIEPSTTTAAPSASDVAPRPPATAGMPSERARIAVSLVGAPRSVTSASAMLGRSPAVSVAELRAADRAAAPSS